MNRMYSFEWSQSYSPQNEATLMRTNTLPRYSVMLMVSFLNAFRNENSWTDLLLLSHWWIWPLLGKPWKFTSSAGLLLPLVKGTRRAPRSTKPNPSTNMVKGRRYWSLWQSAYGLCIVKRSSGHVTRSMLDWSGPTTATTIPKASTYVWSCLFVTWNSCTE